MDFYVMRGLPGSGKSTMAKNILANSLDGRIFSTDDYFMLPNGQYQFDPIKLAAAHAWNLDRTIKAFTKNVDTVILDNTNILKEHYMTYVKEAVVRGYRVTVVTVGTFDNEFIEECHLRNSHGVPLHTIQRMAKNFQP